MNLPNKLTLLRIIIVPIFVLAALLQFEYHNFFALGFFIIASVTDFFDGYLARKHNLVTSFGKFLDPLADKILVMAALVCLMSTTSLVGPIPVIIIIAREFMVSGIRLVTAGEGVVVPADIWGKLKTAFTMGTIVVIYLCCGLFDGYFEPAMVWANAHDDFVGALVIGCTVLVWISTALTIISGFNYLWKMKKYIKAK